MCTFQRATVEATALADDGLLVPTRKLPPLDHTPAICKHFIRQNVCVFVKYHRRNHGSSSIIFIHLRLRTIAPFVQSVLVSSAVVFVAVSLCVCALHTRTSLDTAPTHPRSVYLAVLCVALVALTVATKCYASTPASSQTLAQPSTAQRLVQSLPSSIVQPRRFARKFFAPTTRKKRTGTDLDVVVLYNSARDSDRPRARVLNVSDTSRNLTDSAGVGRLAAVDSGGPDTKQSTVRPMPSAHDEPTHTVSDDISGGIETGGGTASGGGSDTGGGNRFLALVISAALLTVTLGLITCVVNYYRDTDTSTTSTSLGTLPPGSTRRQQQHSLVPVLGTQDEQQHVPVIAQPITAPMLSVVSASAAGMDAGGGGAAGRLHRHVTRELAVQRDRQVRLHSVHTDLELDLPPSIALPDGEELPYGSSARLHIRDPEQESEIYQKCIRPPPNRTVFESESPPPYRSSSAGLLGSLGGSTTSSSTTGVSGSTDWSTGSTPFVVRCHSMSSTSTMTAKPQVATPSPAAPSASCPGAQKTDFLQRTVKIFTGKKTTSPLPQPAPTLPVVVVPTNATRTTRRLAEQPAPTRAKHQGNV